jgi:hypothetical protein
VASFVPGLELSGALYRELVRPILEENFPGLPHSAALLGIGSEILGYDTARSTDHNWGPRLQLFIRSDDYEHDSAAIQLVLASRLPHRFRGFPTDFGPPDSHGGQLLQYTETGPVAHRVEVHEVGRFLTDYLGFDPRGGIALRDWLTTPAQLLLSITAGAVYHDGLEELEPVRAHLAWYPHDVWLYLLACQWKRIAQEEPFVGRCGEVGDDLGSQIVAGRLVRDVMRLGFLLERQYAPYSKWLGTAFARLRCAAALGPELRRAFVANEWKEREKALGRAYQIAGALHNALGITESVDPSLRPFHDRPFMVLGAERFVSATRSAIRHEELTDRSDVGSVDQFADSTDVLSYVRRARRLDAIYEEPVVERRKE